MADQKDLPPMPKPQDFGITDYDWTMSGPISGFLPCTSGGSIAKIQAYYSALEVWKFAIQQMKKD